MPADTKLRNYDPKQVVVTFGPVIFTGYPEGTFVQVTRSGDNFTKKKGADGTINRTNNNAFDFTVTATLMQTSLTNDALSAILAADVNDNQGIFPLTIKDLLGTTLFFAQEAWIKKDPDDEFSNEAGDREWQFDTGIAQKFTGGSVL